MQSRLGLYRALIIGGLVALIAVALYAAVASTSNAQKQTPEGHFEGDGHKH